MRQTDRSYPPPVDSSRIQATGVAGDFQFLVPTAKVIPCIGADMDRMPRNAAESEKAMGVFRCDRPTEQIVSILEK